MNADPEIIELFREHVPQFKAGIVEFAAVARNKGECLLVAVRSLSKSVDPIGACVGKRGVTVKKIVAGLGEEKLSILSWNPCIETFIKTTVSVLGNSVGTHRTPAVRLDPAAHIAWVTHERETIEYISTRGSLLSLASKLVG